jgi:phosphatidylserine/phosphatidylglycerophosphate/cardiolipin synthase-like enzyme/uncharacterized membrane protein YbhN (UPF0104 family)
VGSSVRAATYGRLVRLAFLALASVAIWRQLAALHWTDVAPLIRSYRWPQVALAAGFTAASFLLLGAVEILALRTASAGRPWRVPPRHALITAFLSHAFSQSLGVSVVTGTAVRLQAYAGHGVTTMAVTRVTVFVTVAIVLGLLSAGSVALLSASALHVGVLPARAGLIGLALALIVLSYLVWSVLARNPSPGIAAAQIGLSALDWYLTATILFILLPPASPFAYAGFITACVLAHTLGMLSLVPGGAGVFEAAMFTLLSGSLGGAGRAALSSSLVAYRLVYYLAPLAAAMAVATLAGARRAGVAIAETPAYERFIEPQTSPQPAIEWLIDNAAAYDRVMHAIDSARRSIWITQLAFDADCQAHESSGPARTIADALVSAAERGPIDVRIVLNETFLLDTARPLRRFFARRLAPAAPGRIEVRGVSSFPRLLHAKLVIVDGQEAFLLGSPFVNGYWDDERHAPVDARRPLRELGGRPLHDLSIRLIGAPVTDLARLFMEFWTPDAPVEPAASSTGPIRVVSTSPRRVLRNRPAGATEILDALLEGLARARRLIYIEHQYLSSRSIVAALSAALDRERDLEIIAVLNENADVTAYRRWQNMRLQESGLLAHPRVGLFALWSARRDAGRTELNQVFVHSKVVDVDDVWATAGSANLDGVSLHSYGDDFTGVGRRVFRHTRNFDVNVVIEGASAGQLRSRLWSEHLGCASSGLERPAEGWLPRWRAHAAVNIAALNAAQTKDAGPVMRGFVLPYSTESTPARQLADIGVRVERGRLDLRFDPGWLEVHFGPNWVRNMFS